jgi:NADPH:quinone reductase
MPESVTALTGDSGSSWRVDEVPVPTPGPGQVLVRAHAVSLNNADVVRLDDPDESSAYVAGYEFAGEVIGAGSETDPALVGSRVMGTTTEAFAQQLLADHRHILQIPKNVEFEVAAALPTALLTEYGALAAAGFTAGNTLLITGATSSIGLVGLQIAKALGAATVAATTRSAGKAPLLEQGGADVFIDTSSEGLADTVLGATDGGGVDVVLDHVGGQTFAEALAATKLDGAIVQVGRLDRSEATMDLDTIAYRHLRIIGVSFGRPDELAEVMAGVAQSVLPAVRRGEVGPVVDGVFAFDEADAAAERLRSGSALGKVVLRVP